MSLFSASVDADVSAAPLVRDVDGQYRPDRADEVLQQARRVLSLRVRRGAAMSSPQAMKQLNFDWRSVAWSAKPSTCWS